MTLRILYTTKDGVFEEAIVSNYSTIEEAATAAIKTAADIVKAGGRASIAAAGFGPRWQNTFRVDVYPEGSKASANAAAWVYHKIGYAGIFEEGGTIKGNPKLWLPLKGTPQKYGRHRMTPHRMELLTNKDLFTINRAGKPPLLATNVRMTDKRAAQRKVSLSLLRRGTSGKRGTIRAVPLFVGIDAVTIGKKFNITQIVAGAAAQLPALYASHLKTD
jgi:hypothetical protein